jgi:CRISPR-associated exonuclease Cas4
MRSTSMNSKNCEQKLFRVYKVEIINDTEYLQLSGIQHFAFCRRQWALIHIEQQWNENLLTFYGREMHERVDDPTVVEKRGHIITSRSVPVVSSTLRLYGRADVVEFIKDEKGDIELSNHRGLWRAYPVEYKLGKPKSTNIDAVQLCAQAICLEEMLNTTIEVAYIYYGRPRRRLEVRLDQFLRAETYSLAQGMHEMYKDGKTPVAVPTKGCKKCSLVDLCVPQLAESRSVNKYLQTLITY